MAAIAACTDPIVVDASGYLTCSSGWLQIDSSAFLVLYPLTLSDAVELGLAAGLLFAVAWTFRQINQAIRGKA